MRPGTAPVGGAYPQRVIVVIGSPIGRLDEGVIEAGGMASRVALAAAGAGRTVQLVGRTGDDPTADAVVLDLARGGVGHVALLRGAARATPLEARSVDDDEVPDPADEAAPSDAPADHPFQDEGPGLEGADVELGLRYLTDFAVVVMAEAVGPEVVTMVAEAARWGEARMILVVEAEDGVPDALPADVIVLERPSADQDGVFASMVGTLAARLDEGTEPDEAFRASIAADGWTGAPDDGGEGRGPTPGAR